MLLIFDHRAYPGRSHPGPVGFRFDGDERPFVNSHLSETGWSLDVYLDKEVEPPCVSFPCATKTEAVRIEQRLESVFKSYPKNRPINNEVHFWESLEARHKE